MSVSVNPNPAYAPEEYSKHDQPSGKTVVRDPVKSPSYTVATVIARQVKRVRTTVEHRCCCFALLCLIFVCACACVQHMGMYTSMSIRVSVLICVVVVNGSRTPLTHFQGDPLENRDQAGNVITQEETKKRYVEPPETMTLARYENRNGGK